MGGTQLKEEEGLGLLKTQRCRDECHSASCSSGHAGSAGGSADRPIIATVFLEPSLNSERLLGLGCKSEKFTVAIEGNIGSGKTTLLNYFESTCSPFCETCTEPVKKWRNVRGHNALAMMYEDPHRWSLTFQTYVQLTMLQAHIQKQNKPVKLMERSIFSAKYCFVENLHRSGAMPDMEYIVLTEWFDWICANTDVHVDLIVYLRTKPETVLERIKNRGRREEKPIPLDYVQKLHNLHEEWLIEKKQYVPAPVLVLDADYDANTMERTYEVHKKTILCGL